MYLGHLTDGWMMNDPQNKQTIASIMIKCGILTDNMQKKTSEVKYSGPGVCIAKKKEGQLCVKDSSN